MAGCALRGLRSNKRESNTQRARTASAHTKSHSLCRGYPSIESHPETREETAVVLLRACELLLLIHGKTLPGGLDKRDKRAISALVCESNMERTLNQQIDAQIESDHIQAQQQAEEAAQELTRRLYSAVLDEVD